MTIAKTLYDRSPVWMENLMVSMQGLINNHWRWDVELGRQLLAQLRESQYWSEEQFRLYQNRKLREHVRFAATNVPYYGELFKKEGIDPENIKTVEDIRKIPMLEKNAVRESPFRFLRGSRPASSWNKLFTSGTTGSPMPLFMSRESFTRSWSFVFRLREWAGMGDPIFPRRVQFTGKDIVPDKKAHKNGVYWRRNFPGNALLMSTTHLTRESVPGYVEAMKRFSPELIDAYPSAVLVVGRVVESLGLQLPRPKAIITSAETLFTHERQEIESAFGCQVFNQYASSDTGAFICDCEHGNLHVNPEFGICEVLNSQSKPALPDEEGEIVATSFCNTEQVLIRYRIGDRAVAGPSSTCRCGRMMPRIEAVTGRIDDTLFIPERGFIGRFDPVFKSLTGIYEAQIVQESLDLIRVILVPGISYDDRAESALISSLRKKIGPACRLQINKVERIQRGPNGKFRSVVTNCRDQYPASWN